MKTTILLILLTLSTTVYSQKEKLNLTNALVIGMLDKQDERFSLEVSITEFLAERGINAVPSINVLKQGSDLEELASDSLQQIVSKKGIDTYMLISVRGYDKRFKPSQQNDSLKMALSYGSLFSLFRDEVVNVSFEIFIYRNDVLVKSQLVRCGNVNSREKVLIRFKKKLDRKMKKW
ncbi:MAG: hypothetical protein ACI9XP_001369 [Lentimonas sp.]|jgi:hypothetical protein